jgi:hypothetical protein
MNINTRYDVGNFVRHREEIDMVIVGIGLSVTNRTVVFYVTLDKDSNQYKISDDDIVHELESEEPHEQHSRLAEIFKGAFLT